jgi:hypothetical protein
VTIVLVTHSLGLVADLCDQAAWLDAGTLKAVGPARTVVDSYLSAVNQREADSRLEAASQGAANGDAGEGSPRGQTARRGSGEVRVTSVDYLDPSGARLPFLTTGSACTIKIGYRAEKDLPSVTFGLGLTTESGIQLAGPNSGYGDAAFAVTAGDGHVCFDIPALTLQPGEFLVTTAAVDRGHTYDFLDRAFVLRVRAEDVTEPGLVKLAGTWSLNPAPGP